MAPVYSQRPSDTPKRPPGGVGGPAPPAKPNRPGTPPAAGKQAKKPQHPPPGGPEAAPFRGTPQGGHTELSPGPPSQGEVGHPDTTPPKSRAPKAAPRQGPPTGSRHPLGIPSKAQSPRGPGRAPPPRENWVFGVSRFVWLGGSAPVRPPVGAPSPVALFFHPSPFLISHTRPPPVPRGSTPQNGAPWDPPHSPKVFERGWGWERSVIAPPSSCVRAPKQPGEGPGGWPEAHTPGDGAIPPDRRVSPP